MSELLQKQQDFARLMAYFKVWILSHAGWALTGGELWRPDVMAAYYAAKGVGINPSQHTARLAEDLNFFVDGVFQTTTDQYKVLGDQWKSMNPLNRWGGDFHDSQGNPKPDADHFEHG